MTDSNTIENEMKRVDWKPFLISKKNYVVKYLFLQKSYQLMVSDLIHLYWEKLEESEIQQRFENLNPSIEMSTERVVKQIKKSVEDGLKPGGPADIRNTISVAKQSQDQLELKTESYVARILFVWFFTLDSMGPSSVSSCFLLPLIGMVTELQRRNQELVQVIKHKDEEIEDYKTNGAKVTRKRLETKPFVESEFVEEMEKSQCFIDCLKDSTRTALSNPLYGAVILAQENLKRKAKEIEENAKAEVSKRVNAKKETEPEEVLNEDSGMRSREEEMQRRRLLQKEIDSKTQKKTKKKVLKL